MTFTLAIDQGTHASRAVLFDAKGKYVGSESCEVTLHRPEPGHVEQDPLALLSSTRQAVSQLLDSLDGLQRQSISACGICTQRSTVVACTRSGRALGPALSWQDVRGGATIDALARHHVSIQQCSGLPVSAHYGASKMRWLLDQHTSQQAEDCDSEILVSPLVSYLLLNLLENKPYYVDHSNAQRTQLMALDQLEWSPQLLKWFDVPQARLPEIKPMVYPYGNLADSQIPVTAVCGDQNAAVFGSGELPKGEVLVNLGSGAFVLQHLAQLTPSERQLTGVALSTGSHVSYLREGTINGAGNALSWANDRFKLGDLKRRLPGWLESQCDPPVFINTIGGLGSPWWQRQLTPRWVDGPPRDKAAIAVSIIESIVFLVQDNLRLMQAAQPIHRLRASGGLSQLDGLCQKLANLSGLTVERINDPEATARGVAWLAAGKPTDWAAPEMIRFEPQADTGLKQRYQYFCQALSELIKTSPSKQVNHSHSDPANYQGSKTRP